MNDNNKKVEEPVVVKKEEYTPNRKTRRLKASLERRQAKTYRDPKHWYKRILKEMIQNKSVQERLIKGEFDKFLNVTNGSDVPQKK